MKLRNCLNTLPAITIIFLLLGYVEVDAACGRYTPLECTPEQRRAMQANQFYERQGGDPAEINRQQQAQRRADREADLARQEREEARRLEAQVRIEEAKQYSKRNTNIIINPYPYVYRQDHVYTNAPRPRPSEPDKPDFNGQIYSTPGKIKFKRISKGN